MITNNEYVIEIYPLPKEWQGKLNKYILKQKRIHL